MAEQPDQHTYASVRRSRNQRATGRPRSTLVVLGVVLGAVLVLALIVVLIKIVPPWVAATDGLRGKDRAEEIGRSRTAVLAILAGTIAIVGAIFTGLSYRLNRQGHELDRAGSSPNASREPSTSSETRSSMCALAGSTPWNASPRTRRATTRR